MKKELAEKMSRCKKAHREIRGNPHAMAENLKTLLFNCFRHASSGIRPNEFLNSNMV